MSENNWVAVVDDDESVRESLPDLLRAFGYKARPFASAEEFLGNEGPDPVCLVLDVSMPGMSGPELQAHLQRKGRRIAIVFISAHSQDDLWPALAKSGAVACLVKPFSEDMIIDAVRLAVDQG